MDETYKVMEGNPFANALSILYSEDYPTAKFLDEIRMLEFIQAVVEKPDWHKKIHSAEIRRKWKAEASAQEVREEVFIYAMEELKWKARIWNAETGVEPSGTDLVWKSDTLIDSSLHERLLAAVASFEETIIEKDYHPGSNNQVLNLIHPSLFCFVYGKSTDSQGNVVVFPNGTKILDSENGSARSPHYPYPVGSDLWSEKFQWLPAEFLVSSTGSTKIASYINSLPTDNVLYLIIADIFSKVVPLFNTVLSDLRQHRNRIRFPQPYGYYWWDSIQEVFAGVDHADDQAMENREKEWLESRVPYPVPIPDFDSSIHALSNIDAVDIKGCRLQVIVKVGSIVLTPENPEFKGGNWHVEGMANEKIVATCIYYFDSDNVSGDRLVFRQAVELDTINILQDDDDGAIQMFGIGRDEPMVQDSGAVNTPSGRVLVFPNIYQHKVPPFSLTDKSKPGYRKILVFFLVDPTQRIISTAHIPPQDTRWLDHHASELFGSKLPQELREMVMNQIGYTMTLEEAKENRLKLMEERTQMVDFVTEEGFSRLFNLCEH